MLQVARLVSLKALCFIFALKHNTSTNKGNGKASELGRII
jgi:hypothetical protein